MGRHRDVYGERKGVSTETAPRTDFLTAKNVQEFELQELPALLGSWVWETRLSLAVVESGHLELQAVLTS